MSDSGQKDERGAIYGVLHAEQLRAEKLENEYSSRRILEILFTYYRPKSVLDVGCGLGTWLKTALELGVSDAGGIEGQWINPASLDIAPELIQTADLERGFDLGRRFDLVICLEVAEHLSEGAADGFVAALVRHAPAVLFSAAIPLQGGDHHVNERYLPYWVTKFARHGYRPIDLIRAEIWDDGKVLWWLRQNAVLFVHEDLAGSNEKLRRASLLNRGPLSLVHPALFAKKSAEMERLRKYVDGGGIFQVEFVSPEAFSVSRLPRKFEELELLSKYLEEGGLFRVIRDDDAGTIKITKLSEPG